MSILDEIKKVKLKEVADAKDRTSLTVLRESAYYRSTCLSLKEYLQRPDKTGIIAEIKRKSPSKGSFKKELSVEMLSIGYMQSGAAALSVLTDTQYFGGSRADLETARAFNLCPILRKDFMLDEYQVEQAKSWGADAILLIAKMIDVETCKALATKAQELGMETILEVHEASEIDSHFHDGIDIVGVNNRNLDDFSTDWKRALKLYPYIPQGAVCIAESGISSPEVIVELRQQGYAGFLIGEAFMSQPEPAKALKRLVHQISK